MIYKNPKSFIKKYLDRYQSSTPDHNKTKYLLKDPETQELSPLERLESEYFLHYLKRNFKKKYSSVHAHNSDASLESNQKNIRKLKPIQMTSSDSSNKNHLKVNQIPPGSTKISLTQKFSSFTLGNSTKEALKSREKLREIIFKPKLSEEDPIKTPVARSRIRVKHYPKTISSSIQEADLKSIKSLSPQNVPRSKVRQLVKFKHFTRVSQTKRLRRLLNSFSLERLKSFKDFHLIKLFNY